MILFVLTGGAPAIVVLSLAVLFTRVFGANVPLLTADTTQFYAMWAAYLVLVLGCVMRGL